MRAARASRRAAPRASALVGPQLPGAYDSSRGGSSSSGCTIRHVSSMTSQRGKSVSSPRSASARPLVGLRWLAELLGEVEVERHRLRDLLPGVFARRPIVTPAFLPMRSTTSSWPGQSRRWLPNWICGTLEPDDGLGRRDRQRLPGADQDRYRPAPALDLEARCDERLRVRARRDALDVEVAPYWPRTACVGSASGIARKTSARRRGIASWSPRRLHRDQREHLQQVVLEDIADRADPVVERAAPSTPKSSAIVIWIDSTCSRFQSGSKSAFAKRRYMMSCTGSLPRKWSMR